MQQNVTSTVRVSKQWFISWRPYKITKVDILGGLSRLEFQETEVDQRQDGIIGDKNR